jgi:glycosyltransferase involved in cell wall biosynthesis
MRWFIIKKVATKMVHSSNGNGCVMTGFDNSNVWVVIPAFNEASSIASVVREVRAAGYNVVVVDDASGDETLAAAQQAGAWVIRHPVNLGQGAALQTGIDFALSKAADFVVTYDADGQHLVGDIAVLMKALRENNADIAFGSRFLGQAVDMQGSRRLLLHVARWVGRLMTGIALKDTQNGLRAMTASAAVKIHIHQNRFAHAFEIIAQVREQRLRYVEVATTVIYTTYSHSKGQTTWSSFTILFDLIIGKLRQW